MTEPIIIPIQRLPHARDLPLPEYQTRYAAGMDLIAAVDATITLRPGQRTLVPCGFCMALPEGVEAQIRPRSGLALNHGVTMLNAPGTIDADYRGEIKVLMINLGDADFAITRGMRVAQMVIQAVARAAWSRVEEGGRLPESERGEGGFGSTGSHIAAGP